MRKTAMNDIPDHPVIRNMERTGYPDGRGPRACCVCDECGEDIYEGETYYRIDGRVFCEGCIDNARTEAEYDD